MRVLIIEDEANIRYGIAETLAYEGFAPIEAKNGLVGVAMARDHLPDLIICDIMMPELDGYEVLDQLRTDSTTATIPFIFLTARADKRAMRQGMELGADDFLTKPFTTDELLAAVKARLEKQAAQIREQERRLDEMRDNLINSLPHEFRTPLTSILGYADLLILDGDNMERSQITNMAALVYKAGERLQRLIENYLLYAQIELMRSDPERVNVLRSQVTANPAMAISNIAVQQAAKVEREDDLHVETENAAIHISETNLDRVVCELIENALKFSQKGSEVSIRANARDSVYALQIHNTGRGMTSEQIRQIGAYMQFERRLHEQQGLGLGLIIAKQLVELHDGEMMIESIPGEYTKILVTLPLARPSL